MQVQKTAQVKVSIISVDFKGMFEMSLVVTRSLRKRSNLG